MIQMEEQSQEQYQYKVLEPNDDYKQAMIEKSGITAKFTIAQVEDAIRYNATNKKELEAQINVDSAAMTNIEGFHPFVKELGEQDLSTAALYHEYKQKVAACKAKLAQIDAQIDSDNGEISKIMSTFGFQPAIDPAPEAPQTNGTENTTA